MESRHKTTAVSQSTRSSGKTNGKASDRGKGRPRSSGATAGDPREEILRASARLFSSKGVSGTTIAQIAEAVGIKQPSVYYHFKDKAHIFDALADYVVNESVAFASVVVRKHSSAADGLHHLLSYHVSRLVTAPYDLWFIVTRSNEAVQQSNASIKAQAWRRAVAKLVREGVAAGEFYPIRRQVAIEMAVSLVHGALALAHQGLKVDPDEIAGMYIRLLGKHWPKKHLLT